MISNFSLRLFIAFFIVLIIPTKSLSQPLTLKDGESAYQSGNYSEAINIWQKLTEQELNPEELAVVYSNIASVYWQLGQAGKAVQAWNQSAKIYRKHLKKNSSFPELLAATIIDLATAYNDLGQPIFSQPLLSEALDLTNKKQLTYLKPFAYFALANSYIIEGNYSEAISAYSSSLKYIKQFPHEEYEKASLAISTYKSLSRAYSQQAIIAQQQALSAEQLGLSTFPKLRQEAQEYQKNALDSAETAVALVENKNPSIIQAKALLQLAKLSRDNAEQLEQAKNILFELYNSPAKVYALLDLAQQLNRNSLTILMEAVKSAEELANNRVSSFAYGALGHYYEVQQQYEEAESWTQKALVAAETAIAPDSSYRWQWQMGRISTKTGNTEVALFFYRSAITSLQAIRSDLVQASRSRTFNFQEKIEPVYRELLQLLLSENVAEDEDKIDDILKVRDLLQLSELENFFQDDCLLLDTTLDVLETLQETNSVIVNSIILEQQTYVIWQFPNGKKAIHSVNITQNKLKELVKQWRFDLKNQRNYNFFPLAKKLYGLFFNSDIESELAKINPSNLIFINDGILRNIPMAALHDGQQFLVQKYALSTSLGLKLQLKESLSINKNVLAFGLSSKTDNFSALPHVKDELKQIELIITKNKQFFNEKFTLDNFSKQTTNINFSVVHLATHARFSGYLQDSFIQAYDREISLPQLETALSQHNINFPNNTLELMVLSACQTAIDETRATLGLSGVALRSGVNNVIGSLWSISDRKTVSLISEFYRHWITLNSSKAESLRQAQLTVINRFGTHPANWAAMILISN